MEVERAGLEKVHDALHEAFEFFSYRDQMNARVHLGREVRYSPLTSAVSAELDRVKSWLQQERDAEEIAGGQQLLKNLNR